MINLLLFIAIVAGIVYLVKNPDKKKYLYRGAKIVLFILALVFFVIMTLWIFSDIQQLETFLKRDPIQVAILGALLACLSAILSIWLHFEEKNNA